MPDQPHGNRLSRAFVVAHVGAVGRAQLDHALGQSGTREVADAGEAGTAGLLDPHAERDMALDEARGQPAAGVAAIHHQQVGGGAAVEVLEQHLALVFVGAVQRCRQHQFRVRQVQAESDLIGGRGTRDMLAR